MTMQTFSILLYTTNEYKEIPYGVEDTCEAVCRELCKDLTISPAATPLFSLRIHGQSNFLANCRPVLPSEKYEFRLRFQVPSLSEFMKLDKMAYNYFFHQVSCDLVNNMIPELEYPNHKEKVVGLAVTNMYIEMLENDVSVDELEKNYKNYVPAKYIKKHFLIIKQKISRELRHIKNRNHDSYYVKSTYLESINTLAPNYLVEKYSGIVPYLPEDDLQRGTCPVDLEFSPFHIDRPGFSVYYSYKKTWKHIARIEDIFAIIIEKDVVKLEIRDQPAGFAIQISDRSKMESFVGCLSGYYRLMVKWTINLCTDLISPSLETLKDLKCHGPIGGEFSYIKLEEKQYIPGSYIIRQCEKVYETYYIDIITKRTQIETFKITQQYNMWHLHMHDCTINGFNNLTDLAKSIPTESKQKFRLAPSEHDKSSMLLVCLPPHQLIAKQTLNQHSEFQMRQKQAQLLNLRDFRKYINSKKIIENGVITQMRADWILPDDKKMEVTLRILNSEKHLSEFMRLAEKWSNLFSPELIKMYGFTLSAPNICVVIESIKLGPLDEFLRADTKHNVSVVSLIDAAYSLARALHYLQEKNIVHGRIRAASLHVIRYEAPNLLLVRLGDPGFQKTYSKNDLPWIPFEYHKSLERAKLDFKAEVWAYATTVWEIFSRGKLPSLKGVFDFYMARRRLPKPYDCPEDLYEIMTEGWDTMPDRRFSPQTIFAKLICAREAHSHSYSSLYAPSNDDTSTIRSNGSAMSNVTEHTHLTSHSDISYTNSESSERISNHSDTSTISDSSTLWMHDDQSPLLQHSTTLSLTEPDPNSSNDDDIGPSIIELDDGGQVIYQGEIGSGHYGRVYRGQYENDTTIMEVAIKRLKATPDKTLLKDFEREIEIMRNLKHPNIVKIITWMDRPHILIIMEYVRHRSFLLYLNSQSPSLTTQRLLKFAKDIASGMEYLVSKKIIHRDLSARNILVDSDECVKISDFGLAQVANANGYYIVQNRRDIPIKWYAPESIRNEKFSYFSDVWSFGVTLFEMFSRGQPPNLVPAVELSPYELLERLEQGQRLARPPLCPQSIYDSLLMACWHDIPKKRPDFTKLLTVINSFVAEYGESI